jgi:hypothetical protein
METLVLQHIACEPPGVYEDALSARGATIHRVELDEGDRLPDWREFDAIVAMGGPMSANDEGSGLSLGLRTGEQSSDEETRRKQLGSSGQSARSMPTAPPVEQLRAAWARQSHDMFDVWKAGRDCTHRRWITRAAP